MLQRPQKNTTTKIWIAFRNSHLAESTTRELICTRKTSHKYSNKDPSCLKQISPVMLVNTRYITTTKGTSSKKDASQWHMYLPFHAHLAFMWHLWRTNLLLCLVILHRRSGPCPVSKFSPGTWVNKYSVHKLHWRYILRTMNPRHHNYGKKLSCLLPGGMWGDAEGWGCGGGGAASCVRTKIPHPTLYS